MKKAAMGWWSDLSLEKRWAMISIHRNLLGDNVKCPTDLTDIEIIKIYKAAKWIMDNISEKKSINILEDANKIINERSEEKERMYGPLEEGMERAAMIASGATGKTLTATDMYMCLVALKLSRQSYHHKEDNLLDAVAYLGGLSNYHEKHKESKS